MYFMTSFSMSHSFAFSFQLVLFNARGLGCGMHLCWIRLSMAFALNSSLTRSSAYRPTEIINSGSNTSMASFKYFKQISWSSFFLSVYRGKPHLLIASKLIVWFFLLFFTLSSAGVIFLPDAWNNANGHKL